MTVYDFINMMLDQCEPNVWEPIQDAIQEILETEDVTLDTALTKRLLMMIKQVIAEINRPGIDEAVRYIDRFQPSMR